MNGGKLMNSKLKSVLLLLVMVLICTMPAQALAKTEIVVTDNGWDSQKLHNEIARIIVENAYDGYVLKTSTASSTMNCRR